MNSSNNTNKDENEFDLSFILNNLLKNFNISDSSKDISEKFETSFNNVFRKFGDTFVDKSNQAFKKYEKDGNFSGAVFIKDLLSDLNNKDSTNKVPEKSENDCNFSGAVFIKDLFSHLNKKDSTNKVPENEPLVHRLRKIRDFDNIISKINNELEENALNVQYTIDLRKYFGDKYTIFIPRIVDFYEKEDFKVTLVDHNLTLCW